MDPGARFNFVQQGGAARRGEAREKGLADWRDARLGWDRDGIGTGSGKACCKIGKIGDGKQNRGHQGGSGVGKRTRVTFVFGSVPIERS